MTNLFNTNYKEAYVDVWLLILRICVAGFMLTHGTSKLMKLFSGNEIEFLDIFGIGAGTTLALVVFSEFLCSVLIGIGLATRFATIPLIITMLVAALYIHSGEPFGKKELAFLYLLAYFTILILGSGKYSMDYFLCKTKSF